MSSESSGSEDSACSSSTSDCCASLCSSSLSWRSFAFSCHYVESLFVELVKIISLNLMVKVLSWLSPPIHIHSHSNQQHGVLGFWGCGLWVVVGGGGWWWV